MEDPNYQDSKTCKMIDRVGDCIAKRSGKRRDLVERADLDFVTLALNHIANGDAVELLFIEARRNCHQKECSIFNETDALREIKVNFNLLKY